MDNMVLKVLKSNDYSYEELKEITKLDDLLLYKEILELFNKNIIMLKDHKYILKIDKYFYDYINVKKPTLEELYSHDKEMDKSKIDSVIKRLSDNNKVYIDTNGLFETIDENYIIGNIERNSNNMSYIKDNNDIILIPPEDLHTALKGDKVIVKKTLGKNGKVVKIIKRQNNRLVCEVKQMVNKLVLVPFNGNVEVKLIVNDKNLLKDCIIGDRVYVIMNDESNDNNTVVVDNICKIGHFNDEMNDALAVAISKDFDIDFSKETMDEANKIPQEVREEDLIDRVDLREEKTFTIDSIHTKDMDDAVSIKRLDNGNYLLGVHIADVAYYIKPRTKLFESALRRGTSVYLDDCVIPMIPSILSNGICSLNEGVDRLTKSVVMEVNNKGTVVNYKIFDSVIKSKKKMTYEELNDMFRGEVIDSSYSQFLEDIILLKELSDILNRKRNKKGYLDFKSSDIIINKDVYNKDAIMSFKNREIGDAQIIIENAMVLANETIASDFSKKNLPFIYRVHNDPNNIKLDNTIDLISTIGTKLINAQNTYGPKVIQRVLNEYKDTPEYSIVSNLLLRSMSKARYSTENIGHFALASENYCHFTSPIRRFPDLVIHTLLNINNKKYHYDDGNFEDLLHEIALHSSYKERQANDAEKDYIKLKMAEYMENHIGEEYTGTLLDIDKNKVFILLDNNIKGILDMSGDFAKSFMVDTKKRQLKAIYSKQVVSLGTKVIVKVVRVNIPQKEIYFDIKQLVKNNNKKSNKKLELKNN